MQDKKYRPEINGPKRPSAGPVQAKPPLGRPTGRPAPKPPLGRPTPGRPAPKPPLGRPTPGRPTLPNITKPGRPLPGKPSRPGVTNKPAFDKNAAKKAALSAMADRASLNRRPKP